jgi:putative DNA primase/helicase
MNLADYEHMMAGLDADIQSKPEQNSSKQPNAVSAILKPRSVVLKRGTELTPEPVRWLWTNWLAMGKFHLLAGAPGQGKTTIAMSLAATVTIGGRWPDGTHSEAGNVLIWSGEDDPADTLLPRLLAAGANRERCFFISGTRINDEVEPFDPARDMERLLAAVEEIGGVKMLIVDPVVSAVTGDSHKNTEVRRALQPLVDLASACQCVLLGITHFSKGGQGSDPSQRVIGSVAFTAVARVVLVAAKVKSEDGEDTRILARSKSNIGPDDGGFQYQLEQVEVDAFPGIEAARIAWGKSVDGNASQLLTDPNDTNAASEDEEGSARDSAEDFLKELLKDGPAPTKHVETEAKAAGIAWRTVRRASDTLTVKKAKTNGSWYWSLPGISNLSKQLVQLVQPLNVGQVGQHGGQVGFLGHFETPCNTFATSCNTSPDSPNSPTKPENGPSVKESAMEKFWRENW